MKKWMTGLCTAAVLAVMPVLSVQAATTQLTDSNPGGQTDVTAEVVAPSTVSYIVSIPDKVDFGQIQQPNSSEAAPVERTFTVSCEAADGLASGEAIAVLVKDATAATRDDPFVLTNDAVNSNQMIYQMSNPIGQDITTATWFTNGFIFNTFTAAGQSVEGKLTLDRSQLYNKDTTWQGAYSGKLNFYTSIATVRA